MHRVCSATSILLTLLGSACSSDDQASPSLGGSGGTTDTGVGANQPSTGVMSSAAAGSGGNAGAGGAEGMNGNIGLNPGGGTPGGGAQAGAGPGGAAGAPPVVVADAGSSVTPADAGSGNASMSFFVTSRGTGNGANFGGLAGADQFCTTLAAAVSPALGAKTWRAYLSSTSVNARDRIGTGPWINAAGVVIGTSVAQIHDQTAGGASEQTWRLNDPAIALDERGNRIPLQPQNALVHDILTGSTAAGTVSPLGTCGDWTQTTGMTTNGHSNRAGQATNGGVASSWNFAHVTGCAEPPPGVNFRQGTVSQGGGRGSIYCFAAD